MTTQLRLVDPPESRPRPAPGATKRASKGPARANAPAPTRRGKVKAATVSRTGRRAAAWGEWHLDAGTRRVGRAGVAQARRALEAALEQELSQAS